MGSLAIEGIDARIEAEGQALQEAYEGMIVTLQQQLELGTQAENLDSVMSQEGTQPEGEGGEGATAAKGSGEDLTRPLPSGSPVASLAAMPSCLAGWCNGS